MPAFGATGIPPDPNKYDGRGWEPDRTYHTPRADASRSAKSSSGRAARTAAAMQATAAPPRRVSGWEYRAETGGGGPLPVQPGIGAQSLRGDYQQYRPTLPGPTYKGEGEAHMGFDPRRAPYGSQAGWGSGYSTRREPPDGPMRHRDSSWPAMMGGKVLAGGSWQPTPPHHLPGYESPDRALVGDEERSALAMA